MLTQGAGKKGQMSKRCKENAYTLIQTMISKSYVLMEHFLRKCLAPLISRIKPHAGWNYTPSTTSCWKQPFVGLQNLGCICYMNSMMQ